VNPYWRDLVSHAREQKAIIKVPMKAATSLTTSEDRKMKGRKNNIFTQSIFPDFNTLEPIHRADDERVADRNNYYESDGEISA